MSSPVFDYYAIKEQSNELSSSVRQQLEHLMFELFPLAWHLLHEHGEFLPYGAFSTAAGQIDFLKAPENPQWLSYQEQIEYIKEQLSAEIRKNCAECVALVFHGKVKNEDKSVSDAMTFAFEHSCGAALRVYLPYRKSIFDGLVFGNPRARKAKSLIFASG